MRVMREGITRIKQNRYSARGPGAAVSTSTPASTRAVPAICHAVIGSSRNQAARNNTDTGPTMPSNEAVGAPMRATAHISMNTGTTVLSVAWISE